MRRDQRVWLAVRIMSMAGPVIPTRVSDHVSAYRIELDVADASKKVSLGADHRGLEATFPHSSCTMVAVVEPPHELAPHRLDHECWAVSILRGDQQVDVVGHKDVRVDRA